MKIYHTPMLLPVLLGGCSLTDHKPAGSDAQQFVDAQIQSNLQLIELAQKDLKQASATNQPTRSLPEKHHSSASSLPNSLRGLNNLKSLGSPEPFQLLNVRLENLQLEPMLLKLVPTSWNVEISANLKKQFKDRISLEANDQWPYILDGLLQRYGWVGLINWHKKQVSITYRTPGFSTTPVTQSENSRKQPLVTKTTAVQKSTSATASRNPFTNSRSLKNEVAPKPGMSASSPLLDQTPSRVEAHTPPKVWRIETGSTLKDTLFNWTAAEKCSTPGVANWTVAWLTSVNYRIDAPLQFEGSFRDVLNSLFILYGRAQVPLYAGIRNAQCVVSVDDKEVR